MPSNEPAPKETVIGVRLPTSVKKMLDAEAKRQGRSRAKQIAQDLISIYGNKK